MAEHQQRLGELRSDDAFWTFRGGWWGKARPRGGRPSGHEVAPWVTLESEWLHNRGGRRWTGSTHLGFTTARSI